MSALPLVRVAEIPESVVEESVGTRTITVLPGVADQVDDEEEHADALANRLRPARGALLGIVLGAMFWVSVLVLIIKR
ncbi:MAG: hypothetical protein LAP40_08280 [Acidobacteriia bacterium]|nr:hypothetical protein [Terriglobia bacterium]